MDLDLCVDYSRSNCRDPNDLGNNIQKEGRENY
jgi:hypothetical protein